MHFFKYEGTGNDFIIVDNRTASYSTLSKKIIAWLCDRRLGIGADGLMLLENENKADFKMVYFNSDGSESTMCGNGGRCISHFAYIIGLVHSRETKFIAIDGEHTALFLENEDISLKMKDVDAILRKGLDYIVHTGSPHFVHFTSDVKQINMEQYGQEIRYNNDYKTEGINVNVLSFNNGQWNIRTYERGVENETLSCGTGAVAAAMSIAIEKKFEDGAYSIYIHALGGILQVKFEKSADRFKNVYLTGAVKKVYEGDIDIN